jgi:hypothetical protein
VLIDLGFRNAHQNVRERLAAVLAVLVPPAPRPKSERSLRTKSEHLLRTKRQRRVCLICCKECWGLVAVAARFAKPLRLPAGHGRGRQLLAEFQVHLHFLAQVCSAAVLYAAVRCVHCSLA